MVKNNLAGKAPKVRAAFSTYWLIIIFLNASIPKLSVNLHVGSPKN